MPNRVRFEKASVLFIGTLFPGLFVLVAYMESSLGWGLTGLGLWFYQCWNMADL